MQCVFADNSPADGCHVEVSNGIATNLIRNSNSDSVEGCISDIDSGIYNISVYDINDDGSITLVAIYRNITVFTYDQQSSIIAPSSTFEFTSMISISSSTQVTTSSTGAGNLYASEWHLNVKH